MFQGIYIIHPVTILTTKLTMKELENVTLLAVKGPAIHMRDGMLSHKTDRRVFALALWNSIHLPVEIQLISP
jgi:hypothetical protein